MAMAAAAAATVVGFASVPAAAATGGQIVYLPSGRGFMEYWDDGDKFEVCDTKADGYGVTGKLRTAVDGRIQEVFTIDDGGDSGCDWKTYDIIGRQAYDMIVNWHGNDLWYNSVYFSES
ncbi:hypothetical protein [Streptomyces sp. NPDC001537]